MSRIRIALLGLLLVCSACANPAAQGDSRWLLMTSPATEDYPWGWSHMPLAQWEPVMVYPSEDTCEKSLRDAQNVLQNPVRCAAENDKQLNGRIKALPAEHVRIETASAPVLSSAVMDRQLIAR